MVLSIAEVLKKCNDAGSEEKVIEALQANLKGPEIKLMRGAFNPAVVWDLPETDPPYRPCTFLNQHNELRRMVDKLYIYTVGGSPNLKPAKREYMFINLLESIEPADAVLLLAIKNKTLPYPNITSEVVQKAFPGIF